MFHAGMYLKLQELTPLLRTVVKKQWSALAKSTLHILKCRRVGRSCSGRVLYNVARQYGGIDSFPGLTVDKSYRGVYMLGIMQLNKHILVNAVN